MDFERVLAALSGYFERSGYPYAVIGGLAMAAYGMPRTTLDIDIVTSSSAQADFIDFLEAHGYETIHRSTGYSNHVHEDPAAGRVDAVYVTGGTQDALFAGTRKVAGPGGLSISILKPEHLAAMKVFAIKNDPSRVYSELDDIRFLLGLEGIDRGEVAHYFDKHGLRRLFDEIT